MAMDLKTYMLKRQISVAAMARAIKASHLTVTRYLSGAVPVPTPAIMRSLIAVTGGKVTPNDFYSQEIAEARRLGRK